MVTGGTEVLAGMPCRGCEQGTARRTMDLGRQPASDDFPALDAPGPDGRWPLELWWCPDCTLAQLGPVVAQVEAPVLAVESQTSRDHARRVVGATLDEFPWLAGRTVREFASHHGGSWLEALAERGCRQAASGEPADLVVDVHALAHERDVATRLTERRAALAADGLLVFEFHHLLPLVQQGQFDTVRHGHWCYLSLTALQRLAKGHGLKVIAAVAEDVFGGSLRALLAHEDSSHSSDGSVPAVLATERVAGLVDGSGLEDLGRRARRSAADLRDYLVAQRAAGRRVLGYGAPSKAPVLLGVAGVGRGLLEFTVDAAPLKHNRAIPGARIPIRPVSDLRAAQPDVVLILTWDIADEVVSQLEAAGGWGAEYVLPLPEPRRYTTQPHTRAR